MADNVIQIVDNDCCAPIKRELEDKNEGIERVNDVDNVDEFLNNISSFKVTRVLRNNTTNKQICVQGSFEGHEDTALIILEKKIFPEEEKILKEGFFNSQLELKKLFHNDIYSGYDWFPTKKHNGLNVTITYPATQKHIDKWCESEWYMIEETPELYENVTLPKLLSEQFSLQWIDNILNGTSEVERTIFNDEDEKLGFVLVKDLKWDNELQTMYLIAITRQRISSIRELDETHLPLLKNVKEAGCRAIEEKYKIPKSQLRIFLHYQPSYYHLHVHFTTFAVENAGNIIDRGHLLTSVINNIELMPDYYKKAVLSFRVPKLSMYKLYEDYDNSKGKEIHE